jgi:hypothetical protein
MLSSAACRSRFARSMRISGQGQPATSVVRSQINPSRSSSPSYRKQSNRS